jgi:hypothetical protein
MRNICRPSPDTKDIGYENILTNTPDSSLPLGNIWLLSPDTKAIVDEYFCPLYLGEGKELQSAENQFYLFYRQSTTILNRQL